MNIQRWILSWFYTASKMAWLGERHVGHCHIISLILVIFRRLLLLQHYLLASLVGQRNSLNNVTSRAASIHIFVWETSFMFMISFPLVINLAECFLGWSFRMEFLPSGYMRLWAEVPELERIIYSSNLGVFAHIGYVDINFQWRRRNDRSLWKMFQLT